MELERALSDLAEVRDRLVRVQRFEGYSAAAAMASGVGALLAATFNGRRLRCRNFRQRSIATCSFG